jgi:hypothetical protein
MMTRIPGQHDEQNRFAGQTARFYPSVSCNAALLDESQEFFPRFSTGTHASKHTACRCQGASFLDTSHDHTKVARLHHHGYTLRPQDV